MAKPTIKSLTADLALALKNRDEYSEHARKWKAATEEREKQRDLTAQQFSDLKKRLHNSEVEVARLNGYLARVREDDTVREELIPTGDPEGGQRLVPKRKPEYLGNRESDCADFFKSAGPYYERDKPKPKHWIEY